MLGLTQVVSCALRETERNEPGLMTAVASPSLRLSELRLGGAQRPGQARPRVALRGCGGAVEKRNECRCGWCGEFFVVRYEAHPDDEALEWVDVRCPYCNRLGRASIAESAQGVFSVEKGES